MSRAAIVLFCLCLTLPLAAADPKSDESAVPQSYEWMAIACPDWNCAVAELVLAKGSADVLALPMAEGEHPWVILRRVRSGSFHIPDDAPIRVDTFDSFPLATTRFDGLTRHAPTLLTAPDGKKLVIYTTLANVPRATIKRRR